MTSFLIDWTFITLDILMLRGASWICLSVQQIVKIQYPAKMKLLSNWSFSWGIGTMFLFYMSLDLLCSEVHVGPFMPRCPHWTFNAQRSILDHLYSHVQPGTFMLTDPSWTFCFMLTGSNWTFYAHRSMLNLFILRGPRWTLL